MVDSGTSAIRNTCEELARQLGLPVRPLGTAPQDFRNLHFVAGAPDEPRTFIKLVEDRSFHEAARAVSEILHQIDIRTPRLLDHGVLPDGRAWLTYAWQDLSEFEPTPSSVERAGALLGQLHAHTTAAAPAGLDTGTTLMDELWKRADQLTELAPEHGRRVRELIPHCAEVPKADHCVVHGDFGWRNLGLDTAGQVWLLDWDTAARGHPILDFGKLIDRELVQDQVRDRFLRGYRRHQPMITYPWPAYLGTVRLWVAAGLLTYALRRNVAGLISHALHILDAIDDNGGGTQG